MFLLSIFTAPNQVPNFVLFIPTNSFVCLNFHLIGAVVNINFFLIKILKDKLRPGNREEKKLRIYRAGPILVEILSLHFQ